MAAEDVNIKNTSLATNHCWTAIAALPNASAVNKRAVIAGYSGSHTSCVKHAVDGYSFWGAIIMARVGIDWSAGEFVANEVALTVEETYA